MGIGLNQEVQEGDEAETALKYCPACDAVHPLSAFWKSARSSDGYYRICKEKAKQRPVWARESIRKKLHKRTKSAKYAREQYIKCLEAQLRAAGIEPEER